MPDHIIHQETTFAAAPDAIYQVLTDAAQFSKMSGGAPATIDAKNGGAFSLFGDMIQGINIECVSGERLVQAWRAANWEPGVYSMVKFELVPEDGGTRVVLDHTAYPQGEEEHLDPGWKNMYWEPLQGML